MKRVFISEFPKSEIQRTQEVDVYYAVVPTRAETYQEEVDHDPMTGEPVFQNRMNISFEFRKIKSEDFAEITKEEILKRHTQKAKVESYEVYNIDLSEVSKPTLKMADFANSEDLQNWLNGYYLQTVLNQNKDWQVDNWIEKL